MLMLIEENMVTRMTKLIVTYLCDSYTVNNNIIISTSGLYERTLTTNARSL